MRAGAQALFILVCLFVCVCVCVCVRPCQSVSVSAMTHKPLNQTVVTAYTHQRLRRKRDRQET